MLELVIFLAVLSVPALVQGNEPKSALSGEELKELAGKITAAENALSNIRIESEAWEEHGTSESGPWQSTPIYWSSTAWFTGNWSRRMWSAHEHRFESRGEGKARIDVHKEVLEWRQGAAPYAESSFSVGFDGKDGRVVIHSTGHSGETHPVKEAKLLTDAPGTLLGGSSGTCTGVAFSLQFFDGEIYPFSEMFRLASVPGSEDAAEIKFTTEDFQGVECIKMASRFGHLMYWLDPSHGFALRGKKSISQYEDGREELVTLMNVSKVKEVAPGVWWPMETSIIWRPDAPGKPWRRLVCRASNVVANAPNFDEGVFTVPFPKGYLIDDQVTGRK